MDRLGQDHSGAPGQAPRFLHLEAAKIVYLPVVVVLVGDQVAQGTGHGELGAFWVGGLVQSLRRQP